MPSLTERLRAQAFAQKALAKVAFDDLANRDVVDSIDERANDLLAAASLLEDCGETLECIANDCDPEDLPWADPEGGRITIGLLARTTLAKMKE